MLGIVNIVIIFCRLPLKRFEFHSSSSKIACRSAWYFQSQRGNSVKIQKIITWKGRMWFMCERVKSSKNWKLLTLFSLLIVKVNINSFLFSFISIFSHLVSTLEKKSLEFNREYVDTYFSSISPAISLQSREATSQAISWPLTSPWRVCMPRVEKRTRR